jgi:hypothetical protein
MKLLQAGLLSLIPLIPALILAGGGLIILSLPRSYGRWFGVGFGVLLLLGATTAVTTSVFWDIKPTDEFFVHGLTRIFLIAIMTLGMALLAGLVRGMDRDADSMGCLSWTLGGIAAMIVSQTLSILFIGSLAAFLGTAGMMWFHSNPNDTSRRSSVRILLLGLVTCTLWISGLALMSVSSPSMTLHAIQSTFRRPFSEQTLLSVLGCVLAISAMASAFCLAPFSTWFQRGRDGSFASTLWAMCLFSLIGETWMFRSCPAMSADLARITRIIFLASTAVVIVRLHACRNPQELLLSLATLHNSLALGAHSLELTDAAGRGLSAGMLEVAATILGLICVGLAVEACELNRMGDLGRPAGLTRASALVGWASLSVLPMTLGFVAWVNSARGLGLAFGNHTSVWSPFFFVLISTVVIMIPVVRVWKIWMSWPEVRHRDEWNLWIICLSSLMAVVLIIPAIWPRLWLDPFRASVQSYVEAVLRTP